MEKDRGASADGEVIQQKLSALVRARILFKREIEIDRGGSEVKFDRAYLERVLEIKRTVDVRMQKLLVSATGATLLFYLVGKGVDISAPIWGMKFSGMPGILIYLSLFASVATALAAFALFNSQAYAALIDQVILEDSSDGVIDVDMIKASYEAEWLIFKALRKNFSFYVPVHVEYKRTGRILSSITFFTMVAVTLVPFIAILVALPYLTLTMLPNDVFGLAAKFINLLSALSVFLLIVIANFGFRCDVKLGPAPNPKA